MPKKRKLTIAIIGLKGIPAKYGGVERHTEEVATRLVKKGHEVIVYCRSSYTSWKGRIYKGVKIVRLPAFKYKYLEMITHTFFSILHLLMDAKKIDIIHIQSVDPAILTLLIKLKAKIVVTSHGQVYLQSGKWIGLAKGFSKFAERVFMHLSDKIIAISKTLRDYYWVKYQQKVIYIPNGVNIPIIKASRELHKFDLKKEGYILFVGRLLLVKGCHLLIEAYKKLSTEKKLVIVGNGSYTDNYVDGLKKLANKNTIFLGYCFGEELNQLYANAYICVVPSEVEGFGLTHVEAMSFEKCVIYSDIPVNIEVSNGCGIFFKNKDIDDLAEKIKFALANPELCQELGKKARERVRKEYNWDRIVSQTEEVYYSLFR